MESYRVCLIGARSVVEDGLRAAGASVDAAPLMVLMKLISLDRGVTVPGGLPIPIATPAHGTAYDIAGMGIANQGAMRNAFTLACRMGATRRTNASR